MLQRICRLTACVLLAATGMTGQAASEELAEISYALPSKSIVSSAPRIALEMGLFAKHGLKPNFTYIDSTSQTAMSLLSRSVDFGQTATAEVISAEAKGQHLVILANHYKGLAGSLVLAKSAVDRLGISPDASVADRLKALDKLLLASISRVSSLTIAYKSAANSVGAEPRFSYLALSAMGAALESGAVEGIIVTAPFWTFPVAKGNGVIWLSPAKGEIPAQFMPSSPSVTATTRAYAEAKPDVVKRVAMVFDDLAEIWANRPDDVKPVLVKLYPDLDRKAIDEIVKLEGGAFVTKPLTPSDIRNDIRYMVTSGGDFGPIETIEPGAILLQR